MNKSVLGVKLALLFFVFLFSCSEDDEVKKDDTKKEEIKVGDFTITVDDINPGGAVVSWSKAASTDGSPVSYDLLLDDNLVKAKISDASRKHIFVGLEAGTDYDVTIIAKSESDPAIVHQRKTSFKTSSKPSDNVVISAFPITVSDVSCRSAKIAWAKPTVSDSSSFSYEIFINDNFIQRYSGDTESVLLEGLGESSTSDIKVTVKTEKGAVKTEKATINTGICPSPSQFSVSVKDIGHNSAMVEWTTSTMSDSSGVFYELYVNGNPYPSSGASYDAPPVELNGLSPETEYSIRVKAVSEKYRDKYFESVKVFTTTEKLTPAHPTITVKDATLYKETATFFGKSLLVTFSQKVNPDIIKKFACSSLNFENYVYQGYTDSGVSGISTSKLSDSEYGILLEGSDRSGYILVEEGGERYKLNFSYEIAD